MSIFDLLRGSGGQGGMGMSGPAGSMNSISRSQANIMGQTTPNMGVGGGQLMSGMGMSAGNVGPSTMASPMGPGMAGMGSMRQTGGFGPMVSDKDAKERANLQGFREGLAAGERREQGKMQTVQDLLTLGIGAPAAVEQLRVNAPSVSVPMSKPPTAPNELGVSPKMGRKGSETAPKELVRTVMVPTPGGLVFPQEASRPMEPEVASASVTQVPYTRAVGGEKFRVQPGQPVGSGAALIPFPNRQQDVRVAPGTGPLMQEPGALINVPSDERVKNMEKHSLAENFLEHLVPYTFHYKDPRLEPTDQPTGGEYLGVMAQDVEQTPGIGGQVVKEDPSGYKRLESGPMLSALAASLGYLNQKVKAIESAKRA